MGKNVIRILTNKSGILVFVYLFLSCSQVLASSCFRFYFPLNLNHVISFYKESGYYPGPLDTKYLASFGTSKLPIDFQNFKKLGRGNAATVYLNQSNNLAYKIPHGPEKMPSIEIEGKIHALLKSGYSEFHIKVPNIFEVQANGRYLVRDAFAAEQLAENIHNLSGIQLKELEKTFQGIQRFSRETGIGLDFKAMNLAWDGNHWVLFDLAPRMGYLPYGFSIDVPSFTEFLKIWKNFDPPHTGDNLTLVEMKKTIDERNQSAILLQPPNMNLKYITLESPIYSTFVRRHHLESQFDDISNYVARISYDPNREYLVFRGANHLNKELLAKNASESGFRDEIQNWENIRTRHILELEKMLETNIIPPDRSRSSVERDLKATKEQRAIDWLSRSHSESFGNDYLISASEDLNVAFGDIGALSGKRRYVYVLVVPKPKAIPIWHNIHKLGLRSKISEKEVAIPLNATPYLRGIYDVELAQWVFQNY